MARDDDPDKSERLLQAARQGDPRALNRFLGWIRAWTRRRAAWVVSTRSTPLGVSTLTQEAQLRLSQNITKLRAVQVPQVKKLLDRVLRNTAESARRSEATLKRTPSPDPDDAGVTAEFDALQRSQDREQVLLLIPELPQEQATVARLTMDGLTPLEIAARLGVSTATVYGLLRRATETLRGRVGQSTG